MLFNSVQFLIFFPIVVLCYYMLPAKVRYFWLLAASYFFYMCWNAKYALLMLFSTAVTYFSGLLLERIKNARWETQKTKICQKCCVAGSFILNLSVLFLFKYFNFVLQNISLAMKAFHVEMNNPQFDILLPVGISFYTFQALGYTMDVYRNKIHAEKNFFRYALFVSFFPQLVAGPIERSQNLLSQLRVPTRFHVENARWGLLTMAYGLFLKLVVADNISPLVDSFYESADEHTAMALLVVTILFAFQIYCDFQGYTQLAVGSALVLGIRLSENFDTPYLAGSIKDFWRRWHISLTSWFTDYLYIPLGGNRKGKYRKYLNTMIVFLCSGLWHGAAWHYVVWGGINGLFSIMEDVAKPFYHKIVSALKIKEQKMMWKCFRTIMTFLLVDMTWLFFRADSLGQGCRILKRFVLEFRPMWFFSEGFPAMFGSTANFMVITFSLLILFAVDFLKYKGIDVRAVIFRQQIVFRWLIYWLMLLVILFWGAYGTGYEQKQFIYFQF